MDTLLRKINDVFRLKEDHSTWMNKTLQINMFRNKTYLRYSRYENYMRLWELEQIVRSIETFCRIQKLNKDMCEILDVGCGLGNIALPLAHLGYDVVGVDIDYETIKTVKKSGSNLRNICLVHTDAFSFFNNCEKKHFHVIICSHVLEHVENPFKLIHAFSRALEPGGILICVIPNPFSLLELCCLRPEYKIKKYLNMDIQPGRDHINGISLGWLTKALELSDFTLESVLRIGSVFHTPFINRSFIELIELMLPKPLFFGLVLGNCGKKEIVRI